MLSLPSSLSPIIIIIILGIIISWPPPCPPIIIIIMGNIMLLLPSPCIIIIIMTIIIMGSISGLAGCWGKGPFGIGPPYILGLAPKFPKFGPQLFGPAPGLLGLLPQLLLGAPPGLPPGLDPPAPAPEEGPAPALGPPEPGRGTAAAIESRVRITANLVILSSLSTDTT